MPKLSIIVSSFDRLDLLRTCLASLRETASADPAVEWIVVDDASTDGSREWLQRHCDDEWRVVLNDTNVGYAASHNRAARLARGETFVFVNGDLVMKPGWLEPMLKLLDAHPTAFAVGNRQLIVDGGQLDHAGMTFLPTGTPIHVHEASLTLDDYPAVTFACAAVRRERYFALGGLDERYRNGLEDVDLCLRARMRGWPCVVAHDSVVDHHVSASPGRKDAESENERLFQRRWNKLNVQWARDWDERMVRERVGRGLGTTSASNWTQKHVRILVDCSPLQENDDAVERLLRVLEEIARLTSQENPQSRDAILRRAPEVQPCNQTPRQFEFHVLLGSSSFGVRKLASAFNSGGKLPHSREQPPAGASKCSGDLEAPITIWMLPGTEEPAIEDFQFRRLTAIGSTLVRDLQADLLYLPFGATPHVCPDIPIVSAVAEIPEDTAAQEAIDCLVRVSYAIECGSEEVASQLQDRFIRSPESLFVAASEKDAAVGLTRVFQRALKAFTDGGVVWRRNPAVDAVKDLPPADDTKDAEVLLQIDEPTRWDNPVPLIQIRGWCLSNTGSPVSTMFVRSLDGVWEGVYGLSRPDVADALPDRNEAATAGFILRLPRPTRIPSAIAIEIHFSNGQRVTVLRPEVGTME